MDRVHFPRHVDRNTAMETGSWFAASDGTYIMLKCPKCGRSGDMSTHSISAAGEVNPSIVCVRAPSCDFHVWGTLDGWIFGDVAPGAIIKFTEDNCPGHVASAADPKVCGRCGVHIDSFRPYEPEAPNEE